MIKTALAGFGLAGRVFHAPLINASNALELRSIMSSRGDEIKEAYPGVGVIGDFDELISGPEELVVIATPNDTHFEFAKKALLAGKHVVVDKPMTPSLREARELMELAKEKGLVLSVFHNRRLDGDFLTLKKLIRDGKLGELTYLESNFHRFRPKVNTDNWRETTLSAGGVFFDLGPHVIDQALSLFGLPDRAFADIGIQRKDAQNDDNFHLVFFYGALRVHLNASMMYGAPAARFVANGSEGSFVKYGMDPQEANLKAKGYGPDIGVDSEENYGCYFPEGDESKLQEVPSLDGRYLDYYENIGEYIKGSSDNLLVKPQEAISLMELMEALIKGSRESRYIVKGKDYDLA